MSLTTELLGKTPDLSKLGAGEHNDGGGLWLIIKPTGAMNWTFRYTPPAAEGMPRQRSKKIGLGSIAKRSIKEAREIAHNWRRLIRDGKDPANERNAAGVAGTAKSTPLFKPFAHELLAKLVFKNDKSRACWKRTIDIHFKALHDKQMHEITVDDVVAVLHPLYVNIPSIGREARQRLEAILESAIVKHPTVMGRNVATRSILNATKELPKLPKKGTVRGGHPSLHYALMPEFWVELRKIDSIPAKALQLLILTGVRTNEQLQMAFNQVKVAQVEKDAKRWVIPGKVMKATKKGEKGIEADIPLTPTALAIIEEMRALLPEKETLVFPSQEQPGRYGVELGDRTLLALIQEAMGYNGKGDKPIVSTHGFRATFRSWGQDETNHSTETLEFCLHHIVGHEAANAYKNGNMWRKRKAALTDWAHHVTSLERNQAAESKLAA
jgi:integrase